MFSGREGELAGPAYEEMGFCPHGNPPGSCPICEPQTERPTEAAAEAAPAEQAEKTEAQPETQPEKAEAYRPVFDTPEKIELFKKRTQEMIERVIDENTDVLVFMDRSSRPLAWALQAAWDKEKLGRDMPKIKFANIGREKGELVEWMDQPPLRYSFDTEAEWQEAVEEYWSGLDSADYVEKLSRDIKDVIDQRGKIMIVDDWSQSGFSLGLAGSFFRRNFPRNQISSATYFDWGDDQVFHNDKWNGIYLPWQEDKSYTLMGDDTDPSKVTASVERDPARRQKGLALRREIKDIFARPTKDKDSQDAGWFWRFDT